MVILVVGLSKAGKTTTTKALVSAQMSLSLPLTVRRVDLDEELGSANRSNYDMAKSCIDQLVADSPIDLVDLVDVGAGQLVSAGFASYVSRFVGYPESVVVIWCDVETFRCRHGDNAPNEERHYYGSSPLMKLWHEADAADRLVNTNGIQTPDSWARQ